MVVYFSVTDLKTLSNSAVDISYPDTYRSWDWQNGRAPGGLKQGHLAILLQAIHIGIPSRFLARTALHITAITHIKLSKKHLLRA